MFCRGLVLLAILCIVGCRGYPSQDGGSLAADFRLSGEVRGYAEAVTTDAETRDGRKVELLVAPPSASQPARWTLAGSILALPLYGAAIRCRTRTSTC